MHEIPASLGHFENIGPLFMSNVMGLYRSRDISKSKNVGKQGMKLHKSSPFICRIFRVSCSYFLHVLIINLR